MASIFKMKKIKLIFHVCYCFLFAILQNQGNFVKDGNTGKKRKKKVIFIDFKCYVVSKILFFERKKLIKSDFLFIKES